MRAQMPFHCYPVVPESETLFSLAGIRADLEQVDEYCLILEGQMEAGTRNLVLWEALTSAAVIAYGRCFGSGVRQKLKEEAFAGAPSDLKAAHDYFVALRNKHIAHSVNAYEEHYLRVEVKLGDAGAQPAGVEVKSLRVLGVADEEVRRMRSLVNWLLGYVRPQMEMEQAQILTLLSEMEERELTARRLEPTPAFLSSADSVKRRRHPY